ncbi:MAG: RidA family protein [Myxococcales bacterium]|nr:MAG: RidA family protein [Myxococcales bacterium]
MSEPEAGGKQAIVTQAAPRAVGPYSQAVAAGGLLFCSGQIGLDPATGRLVEGGFEAEAERVLDNLEAVLAAAGTGLGDVLKLTVYVTDLAEFPALNRICEKRFDEPYPARATVEVSALPLGAAVEVDLVARVTGR